MYVASNYIAELIRQEISDMVAIDRIHQIGVLDTHKGTDQAKGFILEVAVHIAMMPATYKGESLKTKIKRLRPAGATPNAEKDVEYFRQYYI